MSWVAPWIWILPGHDPFNASYIFYVAVHSIPECGDSDKVMALAEMQDYLRKKKPLPEGEGELVLYRQACAAIRAELEVCIKPFDRAQ